MSRYFIQWRERSLGDHFFFFGDAQGVLCRLWTHGMIVPSYSNFPESNEQEQVIVGACFFF